MTVYHIFISYSRRDAAWVGDLVGALERAGMTTWVDQRDIPASLPWLREVQDAIEEADLFVGCTSPAFRSSLNCNAEVAVAERASKPQLRVTVGGPVAVAAAQIAASQKSIDGARRIRTELRVLSRDWDRAGRPRARLESRRRASYLSRAESVAPPLAEAERAFLRASRARANRRSVTASLVVLTVAVGIGVATAFVGAKQRVDDANDQQAAAYSLERDRLAVVETDPYSGLSIAAGLGGDNAAVHAGVIQAALRDPVPDDAFDTPPGATRFVVAPVGDQVVLGNVGGRQWRRSTTATDVRTAEAVTPPAYRPTTAGDLTYRTVTGTAQVQVLNGGQLRQSVTFLEPPQALAFSPDRRMLAAAVSGQVEVADLRTGQLRTIYRGAPGAILDVAWSADARRLWGVTARKVVSWSVGEAFTLLDDPTAAFNTVLAAADPHAVWVVSDFALTEIDVRSGSVLTERPIDDTILSAGGSSDGTVAALSGKKHEWIVPLATGGPAHSFDVPNCDPGRPAFSDSTTFYLACIGGDLLRISVAQASIVSRRDITGGGAFGVRPLPGSDLALVGDQDGHLYVVSPGKATELVRSGCGATASRVAVAPTGKAAIAVGNGSGVSTCTRVGLFIGDDPTDPADWQWNAVLELPRNSIVANAVTFDAMGDGFAIGYSDGTVTLHPTHDIMPGLILNTAVGRVRDLLTMPTGDLIIITDAGMVQRAHFCGVCLTNIELAHLAAARLTRAVDLGLARPTPTATTSPG